MNRTSDFSYDLDRAFMPLLNAAMAPVMSAGSSFTPFVQVPCIEPTRDLCAMISLTGPVSVMLLFVFDHDLSWQLMTQEIEGLDIPEDEDVMESVLGEMANIVGGNATAALAVADKEIHLSLPMIMRAVKLKPGIQDVTIQKTSLTLATGVFDFYAISPAIIGSLVSS